MMSKELFDIIFKSDYGIDLSFLSDKDIENYYLNYIYDKTDDKYIEWNNRLIHYNNLIKNGNIHEDIIPQLIKDYTNYSYINMDGYNNNYHMLSANLSLIKDKLARYYKCSEEEICTGFYDGKYKVVNDEKVCAYKIILGNAYFNEYDITSLGELELISGIAAFEDSSITDIGNLRIIGGNALFENSLIKRLNNLKIIGKNACFDNSNIIDMGNLTIILGDAYFEYSKIESLNILTVIGGDADFKGSSIIDLGNLNIIEGNAYFEYSILKELFNLQVIGKSAYFGKSDVVNFGKLKVVWEYLNLLYSETIDLGNIQIIGYMSSYNIYEQRNIYDLSFDKNFEIDKKIRKK